MSRTVRNVRGSWKSGREQQHSLFQLSVSCSCSSSYTAHHRGYSKTLHQRQYPIAASPRYMMNSEGKIYKRERVFGDMVGVLWNNGNESTWDKTVSRRMATVSPSSAASLQQQQDQAESINNKTGDGDVVESKPYVFYVTALI